MRTARFWTETTEGAADSKWAMVCRSSSARSPRASTERGCASGSSSDPLDGCAKYQTTSATIATSSAIRQLVRGAVDSSGTSFMSYSRRGISTVVRRWTARNRADSRYAVVTRTGSRPAPLAARTRSGLDGKGELLLEQGGGLRGRERRAEVVALHLLAAVAAQEVDLRLG